MEIGLAAGGKRRQGERATRYVIRSSPRVERESRKSLHGGGVVRRGDYRIASAASAVRPSLIQSPLSRFQIE